MDFYHYITEKFLSDLSDYHLNILKFILKEDITDDDRFFCTILIFIIIFGLFILYLMALSLYRKTKYVFGLIAPKFYKKSKIDYCWYIVCCFFVIIILEMDICFTWNTYARDFIESRKEIETRKGL